MKNVNFNNTRISGGFWGHYQKLVRDVTIKKVYERFSETGRFDALRCDWKEGMPNKPHIFWDSDVAKWIEAAAFLTQLEREPELEALVDEAVDQIEKNQLPNGYFNSYYITIEPENIFKYRENHELYCAGHLIEAAIAYDKATGKDKLLNCMIRFADYIYQVFLVEKSADFITPGHEEIELALLKLTDHTGNPKYQELAAYFLNERGQRKERLSSPELGPRSDQSDVPVREIKEATGHAVRAGYLYTAMADLAGKTGDEALLAACKTVFRNIIDKKLSITGGVGSCIAGEAFDSEYELANLINYNETCAAISMVMFAHELQKLEADSIYGDLIEQILFNGFLSGLSLDGEAFFYENALEIDTRLYAHPYFDLPSMTAAQMHEKGLLYSSRRLHRAKVFSCSCCPPNITRILASIARYMYTTEGSTIYCNQFASSRTELTVDGRPAVLEQNTNYPNDGKLSFTYHGPAAKLAVRIPGWCVEYTGAVTNGFAMFDVTDGETISVDLPMNIHFVEANPKVRDCAGRYAVQRGPVVYCMEGIDNGTNLKDVTLLENSVMNVTYCEEYHLPVITMGAQRRPEMKTLYRLKSSARVDFTAKLIPYYAFANRDITDMIIWVNVK